VGRHGRRSAPPPSGRVVPPRKTVTMLMLISLWLAANLALLIIAVVLSR
jgi:hypothetical protein